VKPIRLLTIIEATTITGPAKNLLGFIHSIRQTREQPPIEVLIATFQRDGAPTLFAETVRSATIPFFPIVERGRFDRRVISQLSALVADVKPDLVQSHGVKSHFLIRLAGLARHTPWIAFHHGYTWPDIRMRLYNQVDRWSLRAADHVVTVSLPFKQELIRNGVSPHRIEVIHNSINPNWASAHRSPEATAALRATLAIGRDKKVILVVGRLSNEKDHMTLLRAVHHLRKAGLIERGLQPHLLIVGDGPRRQDLLNAVRTLGLTDAVTFVGQVSSAEPYYGIADICVLSSLSEGSPNALLEAMAAHVPVVATSVGGIPEIVSHGESAILVRPRDFEGMAKAIATLLNDPDLATRLVGRAYQRILTGHAPDVFMRRLRHVYIQALNPSAA